VLSLYLLSFNTWSTICRLQKYNQQCSFNASCLIYSFINVLYTYLLKLVVNCYCNWTFCTRFFHYVCVLSFRHPDVKRAQLDIVKSVTVRYIPLRASTVHNTKPLLAECAASEPSNRKLDDSDNNAWINTKTISRLVSRDIQRPHAVWPTEEKRRREDWFESPVDIYFVRTREVQAWRHCSMRTATHQQANMDYCNFATACCSQLGARSITVFR